MNTKGNKPISMIRDGAIKATIWRNPGGEGNPDFFSVEIARTYKHGDAFKDSRSFSGTDLLRVARLAHIAYDEIAGHRGRDVGENEA